MMGYKLRSLTKICLFIILISNLHSGGQADAKKKYCGEALNEALDLLCVNGFSKRVTRDVKPENIEQKQKDNLLAELLRIADSEGNKFAIENGSTMRRLRRLIVNDCCQVGCGYEDILEYCN